jgi:hypothetical protein
MNNLNIVYVSINDLKPSEYNPRKWNESQINSLKESITRFGMVDPVICNNTPERMNVVIGGHFRLKVAKELGYTEMPVVYLTIPDLEKEKELNIRLNKNVGEFDFSLLKDFTEEFLSDVGFSTSELDEIFDIDPTPEVFDLQKELDKMNIKEIKVQKGDKYELDGSILMCGDSTIEADMLKLMDGAKADMVMTDPPYILDYLRGKTKQKDGVTVGFGAKKNRRYLETETLPENFTELWMHNVAKVAAKDFSIICYENWKNIRVIWGIGRQTSSYMEKLGIRTALEFANKDQYWVESHFSKPYQELWKELRGERALTLKTGERKPYVSLMRTRTFTPPRSDRKFIIAELSRHVEVVCARAREHGLAGRSISFFLKTQGFKYVGLNLRLSRTTNIPEEVLSLVLSKFGELYDEHTLYRAAGVTISDLTSVAARQLDLFDTTLRIERLVKIYKEVDELNVKHGKTLVHLASSTHLFHKEKATKTSLNDESFARIGIPFIGTVN